MKEWRQSTPQPILVISRWARGGKYVNQWLGSCHNENVKECKKKKKKEREEKRSEGR
jgi:hypothetical protein